MIPSTAYISPEAIAQCLAVLPNLESFTIEIRFATPQPVRILPPPATRRVLPVLTSFYFEGAYDYLENLVIQIDAPLNRSVGPELGPELTPFKLAHVNFTSIVSLCVSPSSYIAEQTT